MPTRYEIVREVGAGDFAESVIARRTPGGKEFFVKRLLPHVMEDDEFRSLYSNAAQRAINLEHPNIVSVRDIFEDSGRFAVAFDFIAGVSLRQVLNETMHAHVQIPLPVVCQILTDVAAGIEYLHGKTDSLGRPILHSDLGPGSVLVGFDGKAKICDFGVCTVNAANFYLSPSNLRAKLAFAAPELVISTTINPRADIFSWGVLAWELVTSRRLFEGPTQAEVQQAVVERNAPSPRAIRPEIPEAFEALILSALAKNPSERIPTMVDVRMTLALLLEDMEGRAGHETVAAWVAQRFGHLRPSSPPAHSIPLVSAGPSAGIPAGTSAGAPGNTTTSSDAANATATATATPAAPAAASTATGELLSDLGPVETTATRVQKNATNDAERARAKARSANRQFVVYAMSLVVVIAAGVATLMFLLSKSQTSATSSAMERMTARQVQLRIFVDPPGAKIAIDGEVLVEQSGPSGATVDVDANQNVRLQVTRAGHQPYEERIQAPSSGQHNIRIRLEPADVGTGSRPNPSALAKATHEPTNDGDLAANKDAASASGATEASAERTLPGGDDPLAASGHDETRPVRPRGIRRSQRRNHRETKRRRSREEQGAAQLPGNTTTTGILTLTFSPANASVFVDGLPVSGRSPVRVSDLAPGPHGVKISAAGYMPFESSVHIAPGQAAVRSVALERSLANLDIVSSPSGATVSIDGKSRGRTPLTGLELTALKTHRIVLRLENHEPWEVSIEPDPGRNPPVVATLAKLSAKDAKDADSDDARVTANERDIEVPRSMMGRVPEGARLFKEGCGGCHGSSVSAISARQYTAEQWSRYFAHRRHERASLLKKQFTRSNLADVKAYLMSAAADVDRDRAAGVR
ncbi:MAG: serine/threonine protein kinase [Deltaproteobacteria bacterium]|nr:serine/threonine protein kinase [Deltaproteobacteria bacterium]